MATTQEVEMLRRQLDELTAQMIEMRQQSSSTAMNAAVSGLAEAVRTMGQSVSKTRPEDMRVGKPEPYAPVKNVDDWDFTFNGYAGTLDPTSTTSTASTTKSASRRKRKLRSQCRSQDWMAVLQRSTEKPAGSIFIFNFAVANFTMANELELMATYII